LQSLVLPPGLRPILEVPYPGELEDLGRALARPPQRYYVRVNALKADPGEVVEAFRARGFNPSQHPLLPEAVGIPVEGEFEVLGDVAACVQAYKDACEAVMVGADLYAPGVRKCQGVRRGDEVVVETDRGGRVAAGVAAQGETEILRNRRGLAVRVLRSRFKTAKFLGMEELEEGLFYPQSLPAILACRLLDPRPGERLLDVCASPGGKTGALAQLMGNGGLIVAVDRSERKVARLRESMARLGVTNVAYVVHDARYLARDRVVGGFDKAMVDPPCTALGVRPKVYEDTTPRDVHDLSELQRQILSEALRCVRQGGILAYTTCTLTREENEDVVSRVVREGAEVLDAEAALGRRLGLAGGVALRFDPHRDVDCPGYFIALLRKTAGP